MEKRVSSEIFIYSQVCIFSRKVL